MKIDEFVKYEFILCFVFGVWYDALGLAVKSPDPKTPNTK